MIYMKCHVCWNHLGDKEIPYKKGLAEIENNDKLSPSEKDEEKIVLLDSLGLDRDENICCRGIIMTTVDLIDDVNTK